MNESIKGLVQENAKIETKEALWGTHLQTEGDSGD